MVFVSTRVYPRIVGGVRVAHLFICLIVFVFVLYLAAVDYLFGIVPLGFSKDMCNAISAFVIVYNSCLRLRLKEMNSCGHGTCFLCKL